MRWTGTLGSGGGILGFECWRLGPSVARWELGSLQEVGPGEGAVVVLRDPESVLRRGLKGHREPPVNIAQTHLFLSIVPNFIE